MPVQLRLCYEHIVGVIVFSFLVSSFTFNSLRIRSAASSNTVRYLLYHPECKGQMVITLIKKQGILLDCSLSFFSI
jgi:hypothetical protein